MWNDFTQSMVTLVYVVSHSLFFSTTFIFGKSDHDLPIIDLSHQQARANSTCGIYSLAGALKVLDVHFRLQNLVDSKYLSNRKGSSIEEICRAAKDFGVYAYPLKKLTLQSLKQSTTPMILHLNRSHYQTTSRHWVLFVGESESGQAMILDPPYPLENVEYADLLADWDGVAIAISKEPQSASLRFLTQIGQKWGLVVVVLGLLISKPYLVTLFQDVQLRVLAQMGFLVLLTSAIAYSYHFTSITGFFKNPSTIGAVVKYHFAASLNRVDVSEVAEIVANSEEYPHVALIDARSRAAFLHQTIPGSINVPVNLRATELSKAVDYLKNRKRIIVFCQSVGCNWDEQIAKHFVFSGFQKVEIFEGGINEWNQFINRSEDR